MKVENVLKDAAKVFLIRIQNFIANIIVAMFLLNWVIFPLYQTFGVEETSLVGQMVGMVIEASENFNDFLMEYVAFNPENATGVEVVSDPIEQVCLVFSNLFDKVGEDIQNGIPVIGKLVILNLFSILISSFRMPLLMLRKATKEKLVPALNELIDQFFIEMERVAKDLAPKNN